MEGLYENLKKDTKTERDVSMTVIVAVLLLLAVVLGTAAFWYLGHNRRFMVFVSNLSNSTAYAYENESLTAEIDGRLYTISPDNMYGIYSYIALNKAGKESRNIPEGEPVVLAYGDGSVLQLWNQLDDRRAGGYSLFLQYTDTDGKTYSYINYKADLETIKTRYLMYGNTELDG